MQPVGCGHLEGTQDVQAGLTSVEGSIVKESADLLQTLTMAVLV